MGGLYATYHLLGEPETTIDLWEYQRWMLDVFVFVWGEQAILNKQQNHGEQFHAGTKSQRVLVILWITKIRIDKNLTSKNFHERLYPQPL